MDELLEQACIRVLSSQELSELHAKAKASGRYSEVTVRLMRAGTAASRENVLALPRPAVKPRGGRKCKDIWVILQPVGMPFLVTDHAFERYAQRFPEATLEGLYSEAREAKPIREKTSAGDMQWESPSGLLFVVHRDKQHGGLVCVTVVSPADRLMWREGKPR